MEFKYTGIHEAVVASLPPETPSVIGHFAVDGRPYGIEITPPNFPKMPSVGQTFTMDFERFKRDEEWITLGEIETADELRSLTDDPAPSPTEDVQQST